MLQAMNDKVVYEKRICMQFNICLPQTFDEVVSSALYLLKIREVMLDTKNYLRTVVSVIKAEAGQVGNGALKPVEYTKRFTQATAKSEPENAF